MGRTACTEPQCLYTGAIYLFLSTCFEPLGFILREIAVHAVRYVWHSSVWTGWWIRVYNTLCYPPACVRWFRSTDVSETVPPAALGSARRGTSLRLVFSSRPCWGCGNRRLISHLLSMWSWQSRQLICRRTTLILGRSCGWRLVSSPRTFCPCSFHVYRETKYGRVASCLFSVCWTSSSNVIYSTFCSVPSQLQSCVA